MVGRYRGYGGDERIRVFFNNDAGRAIAAENSEVAYAGYRREGFDMLYYSYRSANIVDELPLSGSGTVEVKVNNLNTPEAHGVGLVVISQGPTCAYSRIQLNFGLDGFYWDFPPAAGPDTEVTCTTFPAAAIDRRLDMQMFVGGVEHNELRGDRIWYATGSGTPPSDLIATGNPNNVLAGPIPPAIVPPPDYPLNGGNGQWDDFSRNIIVPAGATYACFQIESIDRPDHSYPNGTSGVWIEALTRLYHIPEVALQKLTNGHAATGANDADVPTITAGDSVTWTYVLTNTGAITVPGGDVTLFDSVEGIVSTRLADRIGNNDTSFAPGEVWIYEQQGTALALQDRTEDFVVAGCGSAFPGGSRPTYENQAELTISNLAAANLVVTDTSHYCNPLVPGIAVIKLTNGRDAKEANDSDVPMVAPGAALRWSYLITNTGDLAFDGAALVVSDSVEGIITTRVADRIGNNDNSFEPGESWVFQQNGVALALHETSGTFISEGCGDAATGGTVRSTYANRVTVQVGDLLATDSSHYCNPPDPALSVLKLTNGHDAKAAHDADVPLIASGGAIVWSYLITNSGNIAFPGAAIHVVDSVEPATPVRGTDLVGNQDNLLEPGETWRYQLTGTALYLREERGSHVVTGCDNGNTGGILRNTYTNRVTVTATVTAGTVTATDTSHYCNPPIPAITIGKQTNGFAAQNPNDSDVPVIAVGAAVTWTYVVTNTGEVTFDASELTLVDSIEGRIDTYVGDLHGNSDNRFEPGETRLYQQVGTARLLDNESGAAIVNGCGAPSTGGVSRNTYTNHVIAQIGNITATDTSHYCNPLPTATVGNRVWGDIDPNGGTAGAITQGNGIQDNDPREAGIAGIIVELYTSSGRLVATTVSDEIGNYLFTHITPGDYYLLYINPLTEGTWTLADQGGNDQLDSDAAVSVLDPRGDAQRTVTFPLTAGQIDLSWDAGLIGLSGAGSAAVGNFVWNDQNQNGLQDGGDELGIAGITVRLYRSDGTLVTTVTSNAAGIYEFAAVDPGEYFIEFNLPATLTISPPNIGADDEIDSDIDPATQRTPPFTVPAFTTDLRWDIGLFRPTNVQEEVEPQQNFLYIPIVTK
ncbi:MAG: SdrD B-like domain-containing protein [Caldilineaceae bacterium]